MPKKPTFFTISEFKKEYLVTSVLSRQAHFYIPEENLHIHPFTYDDSKQTHPFEKRRELIEGLGGQLSDYEGESAYPAFMEKQTKGKLYHHYDCAKRITNENGFCAELHHKDGYILQGFLMTDSGELDQNQSLSGLDLIRYLLQQNSREMMPNYTAAALKTLKREGFTIPAKAKQKDDGLAFDFFPLYNATL